MSYTRDRDSHTRSAGAIAAIDGTKSRRRRILEAQAKRKSIVVDRARAAATMGALGRMSTSDPDDVGAGSGGGTAPRRITPRLPGAIASPVIPGTVVSPRYPGNRITASPTVPVRTSTTAGMFGTGTMQVTRNTGVPIHLPTAGVLRPVLPISQRPLLPTANVGGAGLTVSGPGAGTAGGGVYGSPLPVLPVDTSANFLPPDDGTDDQSSPAAPSKAAPMTTTKKAVLAALGVGALWLLFGKD